MTATETLDFAYDPFSPAVMENPLPYYEVLRREKPVFYSPKYDAFFFSRFDDMVEMLSHVDNSFLQSEGSLPQPGDILHRNDGAPTPRQMGFKSGKRVGMPVHGEVRRAHVKPMMPRGVEGLTEFARDLANARLDELLPQGRFNLTAEYGGIVSSSVIMHLMGMPAELARTSLDLVNSGTRTDPEDGGFDANAGAFKCMELYMPYVEARFAAGADGSVPMVDGLINYRHEGDAMTPMDVAQVLACAFIGGIETVPKIVAHGLMELAARPDQLAAVRADLDANVPKVAEEMIRYCAPAQWFMRTAHAPVTVGGQKIEPGQRAFFLVASANRDEAEYDHPNEFRWDREIKRTLAFGHGVHFCIGVHLARMEVKVMVDAFLRRVPKFSFDMEAAVRPSSSFQWGWNTLPVVIG